MEEGEIWKMAKEREKRRNDKEKTSNAIRSKSKKANEIRTMLPPVKIEEIAAELHDIWLTIWSQNVLCVKTAQPSYCVL